MTGPQSWGLIGTVQTNTTPHRRTLAAALLLAAGLLAPAAGAQQAAQPESRTPQRPGEVLPNGQALPGPAPRVPRGQPLPTPARPDLPVTIPAPPDLSAFPPPSMAELPPRVDAKPPRGEVPAQLAGVNQLSLPFAPNAEAPAQDAKALLDGIAARLAARPSERLELRAYAAAFPEKETAARRLALLRARAVREQLIARGIDRERLVVFARDVGTPPGAVAPANADRVDLVFRP